jgi:hypothetical protein
MARSIRNILFRIPGWRTAAPVTPSTVMHAGWRFCDACSFATGPSRRRCADRAGYITTWHDQESWWNLKQWEASDILARILVACLVATIPE